ncbi:hypothetical protein TRIP_B200599 [uncultured Desulfatiglans sp.]|nr:hypothetical protein TRIP_B200599 [uncultured Desulfatiglans sp.]
MEGHIFMSNFSYIGFIIDEKNLKMVHRLPIPCIG